MKRCGCFSRKKKGNQNNVCVLLEISGVTGLLLSLNGEAAEAQARQDLLPRLHFSAARREQQSRATNQHVDLIAVPSGFSKSETGLGLSGIQPNHIGFEFSTACNLNSPNTGREVQ